MPSIENRFYYSVCMCVLACVSWSQMKLSTHVENNPLKSECWGGGVLNKIHLKARDICVQCFVTASGPWVDGDRAVGTLTIGVGSEMRGQGISS